MGLEDGTRCAALARAADEPLGGTAPVAAGWVCLEQRGAWPRVVEAHPDPAVAALAARAAQVGWRLVLIRRPGRVTAGGPATVFLADPSPARARVTTFTVDDPAEVTLDIDRGTPVDGGMVLVCTHGRRDRCCAVDGRALATAVAGVGEPDVWECSHLGGHRFAPTALVLPTGYLYGRLDAAHAVTVGKSAGLGEVEVALCRGRSTWSPACQVAELAVRTVTGIRDATALTVAPGPDGTPVVTALDGRRWTVPVEEVVEAARSVSCGAAALPVARLRAGRVARLR